MGCPIPENDQLAKAAMLHSRLLQGLVYQVVNVKTGRAISASTVSERAAVNRVVRGFENEDLEVNVYDSGHFFEHHSQSECLAMAGYFHI